MKTPYQAARKGFRNIQRRAVRAMSANSKSGNAEKHTSGSSGKRTQSSHSRGNTDKRPEKKTGEKDGLADNKSIKREQQVRENVSAIHQTSNSLYEDEERINSSDISHMTESGNHAEREETGRLQRGSYDDSSEKSVYDNETLKYTENGPTSEISQSGVNTDEPEPVRKIRPIISAKEHENMRAANSENSRPSVISNDNIRPVVAGIRNDDAKAKQAERLLLKTGK